MDDLKAVLEEYRYTCTRCQELQYALTAHESRFLSPAGCRLESERVSGSRKSTDKGLMYVVVKEELEEELKAEIQKRSDLRRKLEKMLKEKTAHMHSTKQTACRLYFVEGMSVAAIAQALQRAHRSIYTLIRTAEKELGIR